MNKRLRCNEYVASFLNDIISERIKRFVNAATASTIDKQIAKYNQFFAYRGNEVISKLHSSGLMRYDDMVNDMDLFQKMKVTSKGPNSAGNKSNSKKLMRKEGIPGIEGSEGSINNLKEAINNNTIAITKLCERIEKENECKN